MKYATAAAIVAACLLPCQTFAKEDAFHYAAKFRHNQWFGNEDWETESCRITMHLQDRAFFFAENNWQGDFRIGLYSEDFSDVEGTEFSGAATFDNGMPIILKGVIQDKGRRRSFKSDKPEQLKKLFTNSRIMKLVYGEGNWASIVLNGSSKAVQLLDVCAKHVWPGAGDSEEAADEKEKTANCAYYSKDRNQRKLTFLDNRENTVWLNENGKKDICEWARNEEGTKLYCLSTKEFIFDKNDWNYWCNGVQAQ